LELPSKTSYLRGTGKRGRRSKQLLNGLKEKRRYWNLEEEALHSTVGRTRFGKAYGTVV